jgi:hypothetical protein
VRRVVQKDLDIAEYTDPINNPMIPHVLVLEPSLVIYKVYNGYWFFGRPTLEDLRQDLRAVSKKCRPDWDITTPELKAAWQQGRKELFYPYGKTYVQTLGGPARRRPAPRGPLQRSTADAVGRRGQADFVTDRVIVHPSCRLIGRYRSIPSCNRPAFLRLVRLLTVPIIAASAMYQTKSLVTNEPIERSVGMNTALTVAPLSAFVPVLSALTAAAPAVISVAQ